MEFSAMITTDISMANDYAQKLISEGKVARVAPREVTTLQATKTPTLEFDVLVDEPSLKEPARVAPLTV